MYPHKNLYTNVLYQRFIYNNKKMETTKMYISIDEWKKSGIPMKWNIVAVKCNEALIT